MNHWGRDPRSRVPVPAAATGAQLVAAFVATTLFTFAFGPGETGPAPTSAAAQKRAELVKLRTRTSTTYRNANGTLTTTLSSGSVNYRHPSRGWQPIESEFVRAAEGAYAWRNEANSFQTRFKSGLKPGYLQVRFGGAGFGFSLEDATPDATARVRDGELSYRDAVDGVDLRYELFSDGLKETLVLPDAEAPTSYRFLMAPPARPRTRAERQPDGSWAFFLGARATPLFQLEAPTAVDAAGARGGSPRLRVTRAGSGFALDLTIDSEWLGSPERAFPVALDPTITIQPSSQDASFNDACSTCTPYLDTKLYIGTTATERWRSAVQFNLGDVPTGANVTDARLKLYYSGNCVPPADGVCKPLSAKLNAHRMTAAWSTTSTSGALQFDPAPVASLDFSTVADADVQWLAWEVTATTKNWLSGAQTNHGLLLKRETEPLSASGPAPLSRRYTTETSLQPRLEVTYSGDGVELLPPDTLHANGAELRWARYTGPSGAPFTKYEVHRSSTAKFTPSTSTLVATIGDPNVTSFRDTTAAPSKVFYYKVVANSSPSNERKVTLPGDGNSNKTLQPQPIEGRATYIDNTGAKCTNHGAEADLWLSSDLTAVRRALLHFDLRDIPTSATITGARLSLWRPFHAGVSAWVDAHRVTSAWEEGTGVEACTGDGATWNETDGGIGWNTPGVDYEPTPVRSLNSNNGATWNNFYIETLVQQWAKGEVPNLGVLLKLQDETAVDKKKFRYYGDDFSVAPTLRPKLYVTYTDGSRAQGPTVSIASPAGGTQVGGTANVTAAASDDRRVDKVEFFLDGAATPFATDTAAPFEANWNSAGAANGSHTLTAKATDDAGNATTSAGSTVTVHNSALPTTSITAPTGTTVTGTTTVSASASDDLGVTKVEFYCDDVLIGEDATAPYSIAWNTLDQSNPAYDGTHVLTSKAYDTGGQVTMSAAKTVTTANTSGTKYRATFTSTEFPQAVNYDPATATQEKYGLDVTVTNTSAANWSASDVVLRYRWESPDAPAVFTTGPDVSLGSTLNKGQARTLRVLADPPALPDGVNKAQYKLRVDLYSTTNAAWFANKGNKPLENPVIVNKALVRGALGFEPYYQFVGEELGAGMRHQVNVANGNSLVRWTPFSAPGRGLDTVLTLTHNALEKKCECPAGNNFSIGISSLTRLGNPLDVHPNKADEIAGRSNKYIEYTDADGTTHRFASNDGITYQEPDGVHLFLRRFSTTDSTRKWALTTPDRVTYFYDSEGYPTFVEDRNGNKLTFTLEATPPAEDPGGPKKRITKVTDAGGRHFTISYYSKAEAKKAHVRGKIKRITDHSGSPLDFEYYDDGNLRKLIQRGGTKADGSFLADRSFVFTYTTSSGDGPAIPLAANRVDPDPKTSNQSTRLYSVRDPRGNETLFSYLGPGHGEDRWKLASRTDRAGAVTAYGYDIVNRVTTVTLPLSRVWKYGYDVEGKVTSITNPLNQVTTQTWSGDRMLTKVTEPTGRFVEFAYNDNGLKTDTWDQLRNRTSYDYDNLPVQNGEGTTTDVAANWKTGREIAHISQLKTETAPKGTATATPTTDYQTSYTYDPKGNVTTVTDPEGFVTRHAYNGDGTLASTTDANDHTTTYVSYDPNGLASEIRDAKGQTTRFGYNADGNQLWVQDPLHAGDTGANAREYRRYFDYDSFHRLGATSEPKSTKDARGTLIWTATEYDPNDNVTSEASPSYAQGGGARNTYSYDVMDRQTAEVGADRSTGEERTEYAFDAAGRQTRITLPLGVASTAIANDYVTETSYDLLDRLTKETRYPKDGTAAEARVTNYCYDLASDLRSVTEPRGARPDAPTPFTSCPAESSPASYVYTGASYTTKYAYYADHNLHTRTDPLGNTSSQTYDANGNVESDTDEEGNTLRRGYNQRDELVQEERPFDPSRPTRTLFTKYKYDGVGNLEREISPRAVDTQGAGPYTNYVTAYGYDAVDQLTKITHPVDGTSRQAWTHYGYDANGNQISASLPLDTDDPALVAANQQTRATYYDTGLIRTIDYPDRGVTSFDYTAQGWQSTRRPAGAPEETWTYYDDGQLKEHTDPNGHPNRFTYDLNNNPIRTDDATGVDVSTEAPLVVEHDYNGFDEPTQIRQRKEPPGQTPPPWRITDYAYDPNGNLQQRTDDGRTQTFGYDQADQFTSQLDANGPGCGDDRQLTASYFRNGAQASEVIRKSDGGCDPASWPIRRQTAWTYFANGDLRTLQSWKGAQTSANLIESHTLEYESSGVYLNGNRTKDVFTLQGPGTASCRTSSCTATFAYDARERLTQWTNGLPGADASTTAYALDPDTPGVDTLEGNVVKEVVSGAGARTREYTYNPAGQVQTLSVNGTPSQRYFWDARSGNIRCVTEPGHTAALCDGDGSARPGLRDWYKFDPLDRLRAFKSYRSNDGIDSSYVYDAFDRVSSEMESHNGGTPRTIDFSYLGVGSEVSSETQRGSSTSKRFSYDVHDRRVGLSISGSSPQDYSFARNAHGDTSLLVDDAGGLRASYAYKPYGNLDLSLARGDVDPTDAYNPFRFNDKRFDSGSRSIEMGTRRYDADDGRFLQQDFFREASDDLSLSTDPQAQNRYGFAAGNPVSYIELDGHYPEPAGAGVPAPSYWRFDITLRYIHEEMMDNQKSKIVNVLSDYRHRSRAKRWAWRLVPRRARQAAKIAAFGAFWNKVRSGGDWDHKPKLSRMLRLRATNDFYFPIRGNTNWEVYYDIWSNIHYGFVGRAATLRESLLQVSARLDSRHDEADKISVRVGVRLWDGHGEDLKIPHFHRAILSAIPLYERAQRRDPDLDVLIRPRGCNC
jgi:RHS repeat-associated protein